MGGTRSAKKKGAPKKRPLRPSSHPPLLPADIELVSLLPFSVDRKRGRFDLEGTGVAKRARLPGCLPSAAAVVPGVREATSVRLAANSLAWARQQSCEKWYPVQVETETFESDGRVVVLSLTPPHIRESMLVENVKGHTDSTNWQALRDQTLRLLASEGTGAVAAYNDAVAALLRKHAKSQQQQQQQQQQQLVEQQQIDPRKAGQTPSRNAAAASTSLPSTFLPSISKRPLRIGGAPCVVMDSHSRIPMKLRHRVLGKLVEVLPAESMAAGAHATSPNSETVTDRMILVGRVYEAELYRAASSKGEYQNKATSRIRSLRSENQQLSQSTQQPTHLDQGAHERQSVGSTQKCRDGYELVPEDLLLSAADLALNLFPMTPDMVRQPSSCSPSYVGINSGTTQGNTCVLYQLNHAVCCLRYQTARAEQEMKAAGMNPAERLVRSGEYDPRRGWRRPSPPLVPRGSLDPVMVAIDCEMVDTSVGHELARLSVVDANCETLADVLVKPPNPVTDYLTQWSGITEELLVGVTTTLADAQDTLLRVVDTECILVGHSLENDLRAMKIAHDRVIDTSVCFPRRNGHGGKQALRALADRMLNLQIQTAGDEGHDSTEDASTAMRLALLRLRFGHDDVRMHNYARSRARIEAAEDQPI